MNQLTQREKRKQLFVMVTIANPLTPMSDQRRVSPYNINTILSRKVTRICQNIKKQLLVDPIASSPNSHHKNCMADSKENY